MDLNIDDGIQGAINSKPLAFTIVRKPKKYFWSSSKYILDIEYGKLTFTSRSKEMLSMVADTIINPIYQLGFSTASSILLNKNK